MPSDPLKIKSLYKFLLEENYKLEGLVLSCNGQNIVLSCIMYDMDVTVEKGKAQFEKLFKRADGYDDLLKNEFGCTDRLIE
jgi:serine protease Do